MRVIVIGAGIIGAATSYYLTALGASVTLLDRKRPGSGTSGATFAWLNAFRKQPKHYHDLNAAGIQAHEHLARRLATDRWLHRTGGLQWAHREDEVAQQELIEHYTRLQEWGYPAEWLSPQQVEQDFEPELSLQGHASDVIHTPSEGWIETVPLLGNLLTAAESGGLDCRYPAVVRDIEPGSPATVHLDGGQSLEADHVVVATGEASKPLTEKLRVDIPLERRPGFLAVSRPTVATVQRVIHAPGVHFRPDGGGRLIAGRKDQDHTYEPPNAEEGQRVGENLLREIDPWLPSFRQTPIETVRVGFRPIPGDGMPVVGSVDEGVYLIATHGGITLGPLLGRLASKEVMTQEQQPQLSPYRPERFTAVPDSPSER